MMPLPLCFDTEGFSELFIPKRAPDGFSESRGPLTEIGAPDGFSELSLPNQAPDGFSELLGMHGRMYRVAKRKQARRWSAFGTLVASVQPMPLSVMYQKYWLAFGGGTV
jgi:hypothetical protein